MNDQTLKARENAVASAIIEDYISRGVPYTHEEVLKTAADRIKAYDELEHNWLMADSAAGTDFDYGQCDGIKDRNSSEMEHLEQKYPGISGHSNDVAQLDLRASVAQELHENWYEGNYGLEGIPYPTEADIDREVARITLEAKLDEVVEHWRGESQSQDKGYER